MSSSESKYNTPPVTPYNTSPILIAFTLGILVLCFALFTVVYLCKYCFPSLFENPAPSSVIRLLPETIPPSGLDPSLLQLFPTFSYSSVTKDDKYSHECAICLLEFQEDTMLRLLTLCCHVFHQECIDLWLLSHKTCPVCRTELHSPTTDETSKLQEAVVSTNDETIRIDVREEEEEEETDEGGANVGEQKPDDHDHMSTSLQQHQGQMFVRSHSTGHSIILIRGEGEGDLEKDADKYTLKLSQNNVIGGRHNGMMRSCASYNEMKKLVGACSNCGFFQSLSS